MCGEDAGQSWLELDHPCTSFLVLLEVSCVQTPAVCWGGALAAGAQWFLWVGCCNCTPSLPAPSHLQPTKPRPWGTAKGRAPTMRGTLMNTDLWNSDLWSTSCMSLHPALGAMTAQANRLLPSWGHCPTGDASREYIIRVKCGVNRGTPEDAAGIRGACRSNI